MSKACPTPRPFRAVAGTVVFLTLLFFLTFISRLIFSPLFPSIGKDIALTSGQVGSVFFTGSFGLLAGSLAAGLISSRLNHRGAILVSVFGIGAVLVTASFLADSVWALRGAMFALAVLCGFPPALLRGYDYGHG